MRSDFRFIPKVFNVGFKIRASDSCFTKPGQHRAQFVRRIIIMLQQIYSGYHTNTSCMVACFTFATTVWGKGPCIGVMVRCPRTFVYI